MKFSKVYSSSCVYEYSCFAGQVYCEYAGAIQMSNMFKEENNFVIIIIIGLFSSQP